VAQDLVLPIKCDQGCQIFLVQHTKTGKNLPNIPQNILNIDKIYKNEPNVIKYTNIFHCKTL
jgi:hypothetical protein